MIAKRYDRIPGAPDGPAKRIHQEDFCQTMGFPSSRKYQQEGGPSLRDCFRLIREWSTTPVLDIKHMLDAVIFAVVTGNADAHVKNHAFLYTGSTRRMAPLYDQVCTMAWPELSTTLSMKVGSASTLAEVSPEHFRQFCGQANLGWPMARDRLKTICRDILETLANSEAGIEVEAPKVREMVGQRAERMLRLMDQAKL